MSEPGLRSVSLDLESGTGVNISFFHAFWLSHLCTVGTFFSFFVLVFGIGMSEQEVGGRDTGGSGRAGEEWWDIGDGGGGGDEPLSVFVLVLIQIRILLPFQHLHFPPYSCLYSASVPQKQKPK